MLIYEIGIRLLVLGIRLAAVFNSKARLWVEGRGHWRERIAPPSPPAGGRAASPLESLPTLSGKGATLSPPRGGRGGLVWLHAASLGEFEQGRPVIEAFREQFPGWRIVLTFFSPSGFEVRKNYPHADLVCYLPADTRSNARDFLDLIKPDVAIFVKYEFWANYLLELKKRGIPTLLVSALFRDSQPFFRWYGGFWRSMLGCFTHFFVQNEDSAKRLQRIDFQNITIAGDTRVDRVLKIAEGAKEHAGVAAFVSGCPPLEGGRGEESVERSSSSPLPPSKGGQPITLPQAFIAGSSWPADEAVFLPVFQKPEFQHYKLIIAPHEPAHAGQTLQSAATILSDWTRPILYSQVTLENVQDARILIIDNIGMLNTLYRYGVVAYIGGGFGKGIHNTLEPAAFGLPVIFGPKYEKFEEARQFVARGGAFPVRNPEELAAVLKKLEDPDFYEKASRAVRGYLEENKGATARILSFLKQILPENP